MCFVLEEEAAIFAGDCVLNGRDEFITHNARHVIRHSKDRTFITV
jgi:hypothetical protein